MYSECTTCCEAADDPSGVGVGAGGPQTPTPAERGFSPTVVLDPGRVNPPPAPSTFPAPTTPSPSSTIAPAWTGSLYFIQGQRTLPCPLLPRRAQTEFGPLLIGERSRSGREKEEGAGRANLLGRATPPSAGRGVGRGLRPQRKAGPKGRG